MEVMRWRTEARNDLFRSLQPALSPGVVGSGRAEKNAYCPCGSGDAIKHREPLSCANCGDLCDNEYDKGHGRANFSPEIH